MNPVIFAKRNYGMTLIIVTIIIVNELIVITNFIMSKTLLQLINKLLRILLNLCLEGLTL